MFLTLKSPLTLGTQGDFTVELHITASCFYFNLNTLKLKVFKYGVFSGPYFPTFGLNTDCFKTILQLFCHNVEGANDIKYSEK